MRMELKVIIVILITFSILHLCEFKYVVQNQSTGEDFEITKAVPELVVAIPYKENTLNVTWDFPNKHNLKNISFNLKYWKRGDDPSEHFIKHYNLETSTPLRLWTLLTGLKPDTYYYVKLAARNMTIKGPESEPALGHTYRKAPVTSPTSIRISAINNSSLKVTWHSVLISIDEEPIEGYKIRVWEDDQIRSAVRDVIISGDGTLEGYVNNLEQGKVYELRVLAFSKAGDGKMSTPPYVFSLRPLTNHQSQ